MPAPDRPYLTSPAVRDPLGHGLGFPLRRDGRADFVALSGLDLVRSCVACVLSTECARSNGVGGELPWRQEFGTLLHLLRHAGAFGDEASQLARVYVADAISRWEPRVRVKRVTVKPAVDTNGAAALLVQLVYDVAASRTSSAVRFADVDQVVSLPAA